VTASAGSNTTSITNDAVTDAKLRNSAGTSVIGRAAGTTGDPADIVASADNQVLIRTSGALGFGLITTGAITDGSVTLPKIQNIPTDSLIGRDTPGSGPPESITLGVGLEFTGLLTIQRSALTGDVTASAGSNATTIATNAVTFAKMQDITTDRLIGRDTAGTGDPELISVTGGLEFTGTQAIQRSALTGDVTAPAGSNTTTITNGAITLPKMANMNTDRLIGRDTIGIGAPEEITVGGGLEFTGTGGIQRSALTGDVTAPAGSNVLTIVGGSGTFALSGSITPPQITADQNNYNPTGLAGASFIRLSSDANRTITGLAGGVGGRLIYLMNVGSNPITFSDSNTGSTTTNRFLLGADLILPPNNGLLIEYDATDSRWRKVSVSLTIAGGLDIVVGGLERSALTGDVTAPAGSNTTTIAPTVVTFAKMQSIPTDTLIGRDTAGTGSPESLTVTGGLEFTGLGGIQRSALTGDVTAAAGSGATTITANAVTDAKLRTSGANTVIGRASATTGNVADIAAGTDTVLGRNGSNNLAFTQVQSTMISNTAITFAKMQNIATDTILGRDTAGTGSVEQLTVSGGLEFTGLVGIQRSALTGDVTAPAGSNTTQISLNAVANGKLADMPTGTIKGRISVGTGDPEDLTGTQVTSMLDVFTATLKGLVGPSGGGTTTFLRADGSFAVPTGTTVPGGSTGQLQYNNAGAFGGTANITTDGTRLQFATTGTGGLLNVDKNANILFGLNAAGSQVVPLMRWGSPSPVSLADGIYIGSTSGDVGKVTAMRFGVDTGGAFQWEVNGTQVAKLNSQGLAATPVATTGAVAPALWVVDAAHTALTLSTERHSVLFDLGQTRQWATGALASERVMHIVAPTIAFVGLSTVTTAATVAISNAPAAGTNAIITNALALWLENGAFGLGAAPAQSGSGRFSGNTALKWRNLSGTPNTFDVQGIAVDGSDNVVVGDNANGTALYLDCKTGGAVNVRVGSSIYTFGSSFLNMNALAIVFGTPAASAGLMRVAPSPGAILNSRNYDNTGDQNVVHVASDWNGTTGTFTDIRLGDGSAKGHNSMYLRSKSQVVIEIATVSEFVFNATYLDFTNNQARFGSNPSVIGLLNFTNNSTIASGRDSGGTDRNLLGWTSSNHLTLGSGNISVDVIAQANTWAFGAIAAFPGVGHNIAAGGYLSFGTASASGLVRAPGNTTIVSAKSSVSGDLPLLGTDGADELILGGTNVANILATVSSGSYFAVNVNTTTKFTVNTNTVDILTNNLKIGNTAGAPSAPVSGGYVYYEGGAAKAISSTGVITTMAPS
jgi:hypothetical protein